MSDSEVIARLQRDNKRLRAQVLALLDAVDSFFGSGPAPKVCVTALDGLYRQIKTAVDLVNEIKPVP